MTLSQRSHGGRARRSRSRWRSLASMPVRPAQGRGRKPYSTAAHGRWASRPAGHLRPRDADAARAARRRERRCSPTEEAAKLEKGVAARVDGRRAAEPRATAPRRPWAATAQSGAAGNVGGYNNFWIDPGSCLHDRQRRAPHRRSSSIRRTASVPAMTPAARQRVAARAGQADVRRDAERRSRASRPRRRLRRPRAPAARRALPARVRLDVRARRRCRTTSTTT